VALPTTVESKIAVLESRLEAALAAHAEERARLVTLAETVAKLTILEEQRERRETERAAREVAMERKLDDLVASVNTPQPAQDRLVKLLEEQARKAEEETRRERQRTAEIAKERQQEDSKSDKWMREIVIILISALVGGGVITSASNRYGDEVRSALEGKEKPAIEERVYEHPSEPTRGVSGMEAAPSHSAQ
jgi:DNA repair exonuclease SbcCD ATPase subunit